MTGGAVQSIAGVFVVTGWVVVGTCCLSMLGLALYSVCNRHWNDAKAAIILFITTAVFVALVVRWTDWAHVASLFT